MDVLWAEASAPYYAAGLRNGRKKWEKDQNPEKKEQKKPKSYTQSRKIKKI